MSQLPVVMFGAAIAIWGLASIPDESGKNSAWPAHRRAELVGTPGRALLTQTQKAAALRAARFDSRGAVAARGECVRPMSVCGSPGHLADDL
jgi:hypothetical protein